MEQSLGCRRTLFIQQRELFRRSPCSLFLIELLAIRGEPNWGSNGGRVLFAEATSCQLEFKYLAKMTGRAEYYRRVRFPYLIIGTAIETNIC